MLRATRWLEDVLGIRPFGPLVADERDAVEAEARAPGAFPEPDHPRRVMLHNPVGA